MRAIAGTRDRAGAARRGAGGGSRPARAHRVSASLSRVLRARPLLSPCERVALSPVLVSLVAPLGPVQDPLCASALRVCVFQPVTVPHFPHLGLWATSLLHGPRVGVPGLQGAGPGMLPSLCAGSASPGSGPLPGGGPGWPPAAGSVQAERLQGQPQAVAAQPGLPWVLLEQGPARGEAEASLLSPGWPAGGWPGLRQEGAP